MKNKVKIGIVGCGAIGTSLAKMIVKEFYAQAKVVALYDTNASKAKKLSCIISKNTSLAKNSLKKLIEFSQLVIESASSKNSYEIAKQVISEGRDIMVMSVGGILGHYANLSRMARKQEVSVYIPSGAISGVDALKAAKLGKIKRVTLTTTKNPLSFQGVSYVEKKGINLNNIKRDQVLFSGSAREAVRNFPQNINVAAVLSLAGIGEKRTRIKIIASPKAKKNIHEICIESEAGKIYTRTQNLLHPENPKTSFLAVLSAAATLKQILSPVKIGT